MCQFVVLGPAQGSWGWRELALALHLDMRVSILTGLSSGVAQAYPATTRVKAVA